MRYIIESAKYLAAHAGNRRPAERTGCAVAGKTGNKIERVGFAVGEQVYGGKIGDE